MNPFTSHIYMQASSIVQVTCLCDLTIKTILSECFASDIIKTIGFINSAALRMVRYIHIKQ